jgi:hypothetical protein
MSEQNQNIMRNAEQNQNIVRNFSALSGRQNPMCKFFLRGNCKQGRNCKFSHVQHVQNVQIEFSPKELIIREIETAFERRRLSNIFEKMLLNKNNEYQKYYFEIHMKFRGWSVMKLKKESIVDMFLGRHLDKKNNIFDENIFKYRNVIVDNEMTLPYGYIPFLVHFFIMGFSWNTFQGAVDNEEQMMVYECYKEFIEQLQKRYTPIEFDDIIREACEFVDPETKENMVMVASHYLCEQVVQGIKEVFKNIKKRNFTSEELAEERLEAGEENFNKFIFEDFTNFINDEKNALEQNAYDLFNIRREDSESAFQKYNEKREKAIFRAKGNEKLISDANKKYEYTIKDYENKVKIFYNSIFNQNRKTMKITMTDQTQIDGFYEKFPVMLNSMIGFKTKWGTEFNMIKLPSVMCFLNNEFISKKDMYLQMIIKKIPYDVMNSMRIIEVFKELKIIDSLWNAVLESVTLENQESFCPPLLKEFLKESMGGLQEAYASQYAEKLKTFENTLTLSAY